MTDNKDREPLYLAAINCPHEIDHNRVVLHYDGTKPGHNALEQLADRLARAALTPPPGFALVPTKVDNAMIDAANNVPSGIAGSPPHWQWVWDAMLAAAPQTLAPVESPAVAALTAWEYSFIHSSATGHGETKVGPCLTYDRSQAFGVGCLEQREVLVSSHAAAQPQSMTDAARDAKRYSVLKSKLKMHDVLGGTQVETWFDSQDCDLDALIDAEIERTRAGDKSNG